MQNKILIVEDDQLQRDLIVNLLKKEFETTSLTEGAGTPPTDTERISQLKMFDMSTSILNGVEIPRQLLSSSIAENPPVIILTGKLNFPMKEGMRELAADDLNHQRINSHDFIASLHAKLLSQQELSKPDSPPPNILKCEKLELNLDRMEIRAGRKISPLSPLECSLMAFFLRQPEAVLSRKIIMKNVWGDIAVSQRTIDTHIVSLRKAIGDGCCRIESVYGAGYLLTCSGRKDN